MPTRGLELRMRGTLGFPASIPAVAPNLPPLPQPVTQVRRPAASIAATRYKLTADRSEQQRPGNARSPSLRTLDRQALARDTDNAFDEGTVAIA